MHLESESPANLQGLLRTPLHGLDQSTLDQKTPSIDALVGRVHVSTGRVGFESMRTYAKGVYPADPDLARWVFAGVLRDKTHYQLLGHDEDAFGRNFCIEAYHSETGQTREEYVKTAADPSVLQDSSVWLIEIDSLKSEYHKLYVHWWDPEGRLNNCKDPEIHRHRTFVLPDGYASNRDLQHIDPEILNAQATRQGINPCFFSFLQEWILFCLPDRPYS